MKTPSPHFILKALVCLGVMLSSVPSRACLWVDGTSIEGGLHRTDGEIPAEKLRVSLNQTPTEKVRELIGLGPSNPTDLQKQETQAVKEIVSGAPGEGIESLLEIEKASPGEYSIATNLGTAYELIGDNQNALKWIKEGIRRNENSHGGTEWLHQRILETKLAMESNPNLLKTTPIIPLPEGLIALKKRTLLTIGDRNVTAWELRRALEHQLEERMVFVKPRDPIVADLLFTYANVEAQIGVLESAIGLLVLAREYGYPHQKVDALMAKYESIIAQATDAQRRSRIKGFIILAVFLTAIIAFIGFCFRKKWLVFTLSGRPR